MANLEHLTADDLSKRCASQKSTQSHEQYCLELFRRAIVNRDDACWDKLVNHNYPKLVTYWVSRNNPPPPYRVEDYVQDVFSRFAVKYTKERLVNARQLGSVLKFLKSIAYTTVMEAHRKHKRRVIEDEWPEDYDESGESFDFGQEIEAEIVMSIVLACCQDEEERLVASLSFRNGYKPSEIQEKHPELFSDADEVGRIKQRLQKRLRRNPKLKLMAGKS